MSEPIDLDDLQRVGVKVRELTDDNWLADMIEIACDEIARLREERKQIMRRRWVVRCGHYDDATSILGAIRSACPPLVIEWADDEGNVDQVEQMQPLPPGQEANG